MLKRTLIVVAAVAVVAAAMFFLKGREEVRPERATPSAPGRWDNLDDLHLDLEKLDTTTWVRQFQPDRTSSGYTLVLYRRRVPMLVDMNGNIVHLWSNVRVGARARLNRQGRLAIIGRGNLVQEFDWEGNLTWEFRTPKGDLTHHDLIQLSNGNYMVLATKRNTARPYLSEVDAERNVVWQWRSEEHLTKFPEWDTQHRDPAHFNSMHELPPNRWYDAGDERFRPGNILVSARNMNMIFIIEKTSGEVVWSHSGGLDYQHEAIMVEKGLDGAGLITIFNNGLNNLFGYRRSRVQAIHPEKNEIVWEYAPRYLFSATAGTARRLPGGNTLITSTYGGRVFEIDGRKKIVWEWVPPRPPGRAERYAYDHCPQLAALPRPSEIEIRPKKAGPYVDNDLFNFVPGNRFDRRMVRGKRRQLLPWDKKCQDLLIPRGAKLSVEFGVVDEDLGRESIEARFRISISSEDDSAETLLDESLSSSSENTWRKHNISLREYAYKNVTMCYTAEAVGSMDDPLHMVAWAYPRIVSSWQRPSGEPALSKLSDEEKAFRKLQLEAIGYVD